MFHLSCFVGVPDELAIAIQVKEGIFFNLDLVVLLDIISGGVKSLTGLHGFGDTCFYVIQGIIKRISLGDLAEVIKCFNITAAGRLLIGPGWLDRVAGNINKHVLRGLDWEVNTEGNFGL